MRVVGGVARGRTLRAPAGSETRPTSDRVKEAMFSILSSLGAVEGATCLDLFAGSGALGIEALSRGAEAATFVESSPRALDALTSNLSVLGPLAERATVVQRDALSFVASTSHFDVVVADPPYGFDRWAPLLESLAVVSGLLVAETGPGWEAGPAWENVKQRRYGGTVVSVVRPAQRR